MMTTWWIRKKRGTCLIVFFIQNEDLTCHGVQELYGNHVLFCHLTVKQSGFRCWRVWLFCKHPGDWSCVPPSPCGWADWLILAFPGNGLDWWEGIKTSFFPSFPQWNVSHFILQVTPGCSPEALRWPALWPRDHQSLTQLRIPPGLLEGSLTTFSAGRVSFVSHSGGQQVHWNENRFLTDHWELVLEKDTDAQRQKTRRE